MKLNIDTEEIKALIRECLKEELDVLNNGRQKDQQPDRLMSNREVSDFLSISSRTLQNWRDKGIIPFIRIRGKIYYKKLDVLQALETYRVK